jgi:hypothetical protein
MRQKWKWLTYNDALSHAVPERIVAEVKEDLASRGCHIRDEKFTEKISIDLGGPCAINRPVETFVLDSLKIIIPSQDVTPLLLTWRDTVPTPSMELAVYKLKGFSQRCIVVTPYQKRRFLKMLENRMKAAKANHASFEANNSRRLGDNVTPDIIGVFG